MRKAIPGLNDITTIRVYANTAIKVCHLRYCKFCGKRKISKKGSINEQKLDNNIARTRSTVKELILCNDWSYWCTFTISPEKYDRFNLAAYYKDFSQFIQNYNRSCSEQEKIKYLFIPELHSNGAWHMHGFIRGIKEADLYINKFGYLTWRQYEDKFGFISMSGIRSLNATASYAMKYMTKDKQKNVTAVGAHIYYCSKGLNRSQLVFRGDADVRGGWDYENEYAKIKWYNNTEKDMYRYVDEVKLWRDLS